MSSFSLQGLAVSALSVGLVVGGIAACGDDDGTGGSGSTEPSGSGGVGAGASGGDGNGATGNQGASGGTAGSGAGTCTPDCSGKVCGDDGCGDSCGDCNPSQVCNSSGACVDPPSGSLSFFVTSQGNGANGGDFGGVSGADAFCQNLGGLAGSTKTWRAYVSTSGESARDRIGSGPWFNADDTMVAADVNALHANGIAANLTVDEYGEQIDLVNAHDIITGSNANGDFGGSNCDDYTSSDISDTTRVGHSDGGGVGDGAFDSWNNAHETNGCDEVSLQSTASQAHLYCFAID